MYNDPWPWKKFERWEFACKCGCGFDTVDAELVNVLLDLKKHFGGARVTVNSGCRCEKYNAMVGGARNSQHVLGRAADVVVDGVSTTEVYGYLTSKYIGKYGIGRYDSFVHIDTRSVSLWRQN